MGERWRPVRGAPGYEVSDQGAVRRLVLDEALDQVVVYAVATWPNAKHYVQVELEIADGEPALRAVHRLVLDAFVGPAPPGHQANHRDGNKGNNRLTNLEWVTARENTRHARATGLVKSKPRQSHCHRGHLKDQRYTDHGVEYLRCSTCRQRATVRRRYGDAHFDPATLLAMTAQ